MVIDPIEALFEKIALNKSRGGPGALSKHKELADRLNNAIGERREALERAAFGELQPSQTQDPLGSVRYAIRVKDPEAIKQAALNAYVNKHFTAFRLAGEFDAEIAPLVDFLYTFGELASLNQRVFIRAAMADPPGERVRL